MIKKNQNIINVANVLLDILILIVTYYVAVYIKFGHFVAAVSIKIWNYPYNAVATAYALMAVLFYAVGRIYGPFRYKEILKDTAKVILLNAVSIFIVISALFILKVHNFSRSVLVLYYLISTFAVVLKIFFIRILRRHLRKKGFNQKHVVIVGDGHLARQYAADVKDNYQIGVTVDGYLGDNENTMIGKRLGNYREAEEVFESRDIDEIVIAVEPDEYRNIKGIISTANKEGIRLSLIPFFNDYFPSNVSMNIIGRSKLIDMRSTPLDNIGWAFIKRMTDIVGSFFLIIIASPLMLLTAIGVKLSSPGPVFFKQERVGKNKKTFYMLKFRSMRVNDRESTGWSTETDSRRTKFGSFIRKTSIDELPQLFNVFIGDMSLVGPRPEVPHYVDKFKEDIPMYLVRQQIRPGMTGLAQVNGLRGDTSINRRVKYDLWYIDNWSYMLDISILFKTIFGGKFINNEKL